MSKRDFQIDPETGEFISCPGFVTMKMVNLTDEEKAYDITIDRISSYHYSVGEDFLDTQEGIVDSRVFLGYLLGRCPDKADEIIDHLNFDYFCMTHLSDTFGFDEDNDIDEYYKYFCDFVNLTKFTKEKVNEILISVNYYYNEV